MNPQDSQNIPQMIFPGQPASQASQGMPQPMVQQPTMQQPIQQPTMQLPMAQPTPPVIQQPTPAVQAPMQHNLTAANIGSVAMNANQAAPVSPRKESPTSTQSTLLISELRDNMVIMKDGSFRAVVACKAVNFDLMSDAEREGVEYSYQNFLNSLNFTTQILIRSQRVDIGPYIEQLMDIRRDNDNMLLGVLMDDYINFIDILSQEANIMDKSFFVVVPYYSSAESEKDLQQTKNFFKTFSRSKGPEVKKIDRATYDKATAELNNRIDSIISGLFQIGIHATRLNTRELGQLYYNFNNPDTAVREPLVDFSQVATVYVKKGETNG